MGLVFVLVILFLPTPTKAVAIDIIINEIMYDLPTPGSDNKREWVEIYNSGSEPVTIITGSGTGSWRFFDGSNHTFTLFSGSNILQSQSFAILADDPATFIQDHPDFSGTIFKVSLSLNNDTDTLKISADKGQSWFSEVTYTNSCGGDSDGFSLERQGEKFLVSQKEDGTPGQENSKYEPLPENFNQFSQFLDFNCGALHLKSTINFVTDGDTVRVEDLGNYPTTIRLLGIDAPEYNSDHKQLFYDEAKNFLFQKIFQKDVDILISPKKSQKEDEYHRTLAILIFDDQIVNLSILQEGLAKRFSAENLLIKTEDWNETELDAKTKKVGIWSNFQPGRIIISELLPDPVGKDSDLEWIEFQNVSDRSVDLSNWILDKKTQFKIPEGTILDAGKFLVFYHPQTKINLSNDGDSLDLYFPDGILVDSVSYPKAPEGQSYAHLPGGSWQWTKNPTPGKSNVIVVEEPKQEALPPKELSPPASSGITDTQDTNVKSVSRKITTVTTQPKYVVKVLSYRSYLSQNQNSKLLVEKSQSNWYIKSVKATVTLADFLLIFLLGDYLWTLSLRRLQKHASWEGNWPGG